MGNNIACQRLECYYRSFCQGHLSHVKDDEKEEKRNYCTLCLQITVQ